MKLFYAAPALLGPGSIILPGNWARMLRRYGEKANFFTPFRELVFEEVRKTEFPNAVSRLSCIFCCETEAGLREFLNATQRAADEMYEVETMDEQPPIFRADWNIVQGIPAKGFGTKWRRWPGAIGQQSRRSD